jgi:hypothetical protein
MTEQKSIENGLKDLIEESLTFMEKIRSNIPLPTESIITLAMDDDIDRDLALRPWGIKHSEFPDFVKKFTYANLSDRIEFVKSFDVPVVSKEQLSSPFAFDVMQNLNLVSEMDLAKSVLESVENKTGDIEKVNLLKVFKKIELNLTSRVEVLCQYLSEIEKIGGVNSLNDEQAREKLLQSHEILKLYVQLILNVRQRILDIYNSIGHGDLAFICENDFDGSPKVLNYKIPELNPLIGVVKSESLKWLPMEKC